jgi:hypothetical protein
MVLSASLPTLGAGALKDRDDPKVFGTAKASFCIGFRTTLFTKPFNQNRNPTFFNLLRPSTRPSPSTALEVKSLWTCSSLVALIKMSLLSVSFYFPSQLFFLHCSRLLAEVHRWTDILLPRVQRCSTRRCSQVCPRIWRGTRKPDWHGSSYSCPSFQR